MRIVNKLANIFIWFFGALSAQAALIELHNVPKKYTIIAKVPCNEKICEGLAQIEII